MIMIFKEWSKDRMVIVVMMTSIVSSFISTIIGNLRVSTMADVFNINDSLKFVVMQLVFYYAFECLFDHISLALRKTCCSHMSKGLSDEWFDKISDTDYKLFTKHNIAEIDMSSEFILDIVEIFKESYNLITLSFSIIATVFSMFLVGGGFTLVIVGTAYVFGVVLLSYLYKRYIRYNKKIQKYRKIGKQTMFNSVKGFEEFRIFGRQYIDKETVHHSNEQIYSTSVKKYRFDILVNSCISWINIIAVVGTILYSVDSIRNGNMNTTIAFALVMYVMKMIDPLSTLIEVVDGLSTALSKSDVYEESMKYENDDRSNQNKIINEFSDRIEVKNIVFRYDESNVIDDMNLVITKGQHIGICGESGASKSTILKLLNRFYKPNEGLITIDGIDINHIEDGSLRRIISCVNQETVIFDGTIMDNVKYADINATEEDVIEHARMLIYTTSFRHFLMGYILR